MKIGSSRGCFGFLGGRGSDKFVIFARDWYYSLLEHCTLAITNNSQEVTFVVDVLSWTVHKSQNQRRKKVMISILFFVTKNACPDEEDKFQTIRKLRVWGKFQPNPSWLSNSTVWKSRIKTASGNPVAQPSFYRIEQIPGKRGPAPVLELSGLCFLWNSGMKSIRRERFTTGTI